MAFADTNENTVERIKQSADIVQIIGECVDLKKSGVRHVGLCPFHGEKTPSFSVHGGQQFFHCFGCGESGDVISFMMKYYNLDFPDALKELGRRYNIEVTERSKTPEEERRERLRNDLFAINEKCATIFSSYLATAPGAKVARDYLERRGVAKSLIETFRLGYAPSTEKEGWNYLGGKLSGHEHELAVAAGLLVKKDRGGTYDRFRDRIVFPIADISGRICGFGGRIIGEGQPKYLNSPETEVFRKSQLLLGLYQQKEAIRQADQAILVEGNFDLVSLVGHEIRNVVAPLGTALTREQLRLLKRFAGGVTLLFDGDEAGGKAAERAVPLFLAEQIPGRVVLLPDGHDPDTFVRECGHDGLSRLLEHGETLPEFLLKRLIARHGLHLDGKSRILEELHPLIRAAASPLQRSLFISHFAGQLGMSGDELERFLSAPSQKQQEKEEDIPRSVTSKRPDAATPLSIAQRQLIEFMILHPQHITILDEAGLQDFLAGSIGEVIFLQYRSMLADNPDAEPEELLSFLPDGAERQMVADFLLQAHAENDPGNEEGRQQQLLDAKLFLQKRRLRIEANTVLEKIREAEGSGDERLVAELLMEQVRITQKMHEIDR